MRWFGQRLAAVVAVAFGFMAVTLIVTPGISAAGCDPNMSFNPATRACTLPPAIPDWYTAPPAYSPSFAAQDVPPPPPPPPSWAGWQAPMWSVGHHQWGVYIGNVWVPL
ncbi:MAG: hypothetical protein JOZ00_14625 [Mycobacterium sp.]|uniref:hypothetical protein n=1 Tax=Mycobacterium sp. TaxID=1785 RepID=UPI001EC489B5|nr:hypothetical protein [Mycobacterium sp.]MBV8787908.1 hypothetical protein [Mycobacterium sp.]